MQIGSQRVRPAEYFQGQSSANWNASSLNGLSSGLIAVEQVTEKIFLELGQDINLLHDNAKNISGLAGNVVDVLNGEGGENTLNHLQLLVERCHLWLDRNNRKSAEICDLLEHVLNHIHELELPVLGLRKVIKTLHSLRVSTRIESSKGYASGAGVLAASLDNLVTLVHDKVLDIFDQLGGLVAVIDRSIQMEESAQHGLIREASAEVDKARKLLNGFLNNCMKTSHWTDRLKSRSEGVASSFSEIVSALQFQDITRQRLEHVQKALDNLGEHLDHFSMRTDFSKDAEAERLFGCICKLQHDQVEFAASEFVSAADKLSINLQNMSANVMSMAEDTSQLVRVSDDDSDDRYAVVLQSLQTIAEHLEKTGNVHEATVQNLSEVTTGVSKVSTLVEEIEFIGEEMQLLAINAAIGAAHAQRRGAGLDVIAQNIQDVAEEASAHATALAGRCDVIAEHATRLQVIDDTSQEDAGDVAPLLQEANERMASFDASHRHLTELATQIDVDAGELSRDVFKIVTNLNIGDLFSQKISPVLDRFRELSQGQCEDLSETDSANLEALFKDLELCYTMDSERRVHKEFVSSQWLADDEISDQQDRWEESRQHDLGDNVDLF